MEVKWNDTVIKILRGDITEQDTEALVNAANSRLAGGGGVDGAIHAAGGPAIMRELDSIRARQGGCPAGQAVITTGGRLKAKHVIHTVGPVYHGRDAEAELLAACYGNSIKLAAGHNIHSLSFPSISTGVYRYPIRLAAPVALRTVFSQLQIYPLQEIRFVLFSDADYEVYRKVVTELKLPE
ncbi:Hypothetical protein LUCI_1928 [Lucifera butyrica]|uniref:Macro domain-containing protein n=1 Tax=Lucifera butyrica TaxID=1351585 RepID=A0A498R8U1_9FIRM|nr:O-acetyl-ADP-ribose deacetylase [Lucifera butyrica]VBB06692.1 Hypothetical protein LUCI_1928 [Lucifera butyrica]